MSRQYLPDTTGPDGVRVTIAFEPAVQRLARHRERLGLREFYLPLNRVAHRLLARPRTASRALAAAALVVPVGVLGAGCGVPSLPWAGSCASFDEARDRANSSDGPDGPDGGGSTALAVTPARPGAGDDVEVSRADGDRMTYGSAFLYSDKGAGCRTFHLTLGDDGAGSWTELEFEGSGEGLEILVGSAINEDALSQTYPVPSSAEDGDYLLCLSDASGWDRWPDLLCGEFSL